MREMKNSDVEWLPQIPFNWTRARLKDVISVLTDYTANGSFADLAKNVEYHDYIDYARLVRLTDLRDNLENPGIYVDEKSYKYLEKSKLFGNEILVANVGAYAGLFCEMPPIDIPATLGPNMFLIRTNKRMLNHYLYYLGNTRLIWNQLAQKSFSSAQPKLNKTDVKTIQIVFPSIKQQQHIITYLDTKCAEIDSISEDIRKEIETLQEYRKSVITEAVTKGLDPNVEMKDSGVEWIGEIPNSWELEKGKYVFIQKNERGNTICLQLLSPTQKYGVIPQDKYEELSGMKAVKLNEKVDLSELKTVHKGAFCISLRSFQGGFEYSDYEGVVSPAYQIFYPTRNICDDYYRYLFKTQGFIQEMNSFTMSLRDGKNIAFEDFGNSLIPVPPLSIQNDIATFLNTKCSEIDSIIADKQKQLDVLAEYRKSLIYEYVTGKKEVPTK